MKKQFYSQLIDVESLVSELDKMGFSKSEREHLIALIDSNIHHTILELILAELSEEDKKAFLNYVASEEHDKVWEFLNKKVDHIENKIIKAATELKKELQKDIRETQKEHS